MTAVLRKYSLLILVICFSYSHSAWAAPKNIIFLIADGMGFEQVKAAGMYANGAEGNFVFESFPYQAQVTTYSANSSITDSAAAATAMATKTKVNNGVISMAIPGDNSELYTLLEYFRDQGKRTGLVTTTYISHATPAAFGAHEIIRSNYTAIVTDYLNQTKPDVLFGGALHMSSAAAVSAGYTVVTNKAELQSLNTETVALVSGQFGNNNLPYMYDGTGYATLPELSEMTLSALEILDGDPDGFFIMVETGRIDHAGHNNNIERNIFEIIELNDTVDTILTWAEGRADTLILLTSDHETGGLSVLNNNGQGEFPDVSWSTNDHTAVNVPLYAIGENADLVSGIMDNTNFFNLVTFCSTGTPPADDSVCNGLDDDCDGEIDEDYVVDTSCYLPGACAALNTPSSCTLGVESVCSTGTPSTEVCEGSVDENCDGTVDDGCVCIEGDTRPTTCGVGECGAMGVETCAGGAWGGDTCTPGTPSTEVCEGSVDENCDGTVDDGCDCIDGDIRPTTCGVGECGAIGLETCAGGAWGGDTCTPGTPAADDSVCNDLDDDCDGLIDEDYVVDESCYLPGACAALNKPSSCTDGTESVCSTGTPSIEECSGFAKEETWKYDIENTGTTWMNVGYDDSGWSVGNGIFGEEPDAAEYGYSITTPISNTNMSMFFRKTFTVCDPSAVTALSLHSLFDDGIAVYINGTQVYSAGTSGNPPLWDGSADNHEARNYEPADLTSIIGLSALQSLLVSGDNVLAVGIYNQAGGSSDIVWDGELVISHNAVSLCNGIDDDCDGEIDEGYVVDESCYLPGVCAALNSPSSCTDGVESVCSTGTPAADDSVCNGLDDDCDGFTDEDYVVDTSCYLLGPCADSNIASSCTDGVESVCLTGTPLIEDCSAKVNEPIIAREETWKYDVENTGTTWMNVGYDDSGWSVGNGIFGEEPDAAQHGYSITTPISNTNMSMFFRKTFTVCDPSEVTALSLNSLFDDGIAVYINGNQVYLEGTSGNPPLWDGSADNHEALDYEPADLTSVIGLSALQSLLVPGNNVLAVGIYNQAGGSSDIVWDGELVISHNVVGAVCNGIDDDCDGEIDEGYVADTGCYLPGACADFNIPSSCTGGVESVCSTGTPAADDSICNGLDDDCDGPVDEEYLVDTSCYLPGACAASNAPSSCTDGIESVCSTGTPAADDSVCNGLDDDCDGSTDEEYVVDTGCYLPGACAASNTPSSCTAGVESVCLTGTPSAEVCEGSIDENCDSVVDDGCICIDGNTRTTTCGVGECGGSGAETCAGGAWVGDTCTPGTPAADDSSCNGLDDDCDGSVDEEYVITGTTCGQGVCSSTGQIECQSGVEVDTCTEGSIETEGPLENPSCNDNLDNDCDGDTDIDDSDCYMDNITCFDGEDNDGNGTMDCADPSCEGAIKDETLCGTEECRTTGELICNEGALIDTCEPLPPDTGSDNTCNEGLSLNTGWHMFSLPFTPIATDIETVLTQISGMYLHVWSYEGMTDCEWKVYPFDQSYAASVCELSELTSGKGYWIEMDGDTNLAISGLASSNVISLKKGWNLIGLNSADSIDISNALSSIVGKYISVWSYDDGHWKVYAPAYPEFSDLQTMIPYHGYWINASEATDWTLP